MYNNNLALLPRVAENRPVFGNSFSAAILPSDDVWRSRDVGKTRLTVSLRVHSALAVLFSIAHYKLKRYARAQD